MSEGQEERSDECPSLTMTGVRENPPKGNRILLTPVTYCRFTIPEGRGVPGGRAPRYNCDGHCELGEGLESSEGSEE